MHISLPPFQDPQLDDLEQAQADSALAPLQPVTMPVPLPANQTTEQQQAHLIGELDNLNARTSQLMQDHPSLERVYQLQLTTTFPDLLQPVNPNQIFYSRYREDTEGRKYLLSSEPLGALLNRVRAADAQTYLTAHSGAFYRQPDTLEADKSLASTRTAVTLANALEVALAVSLNEFWRAQENQQPNTEQQLVALRRQVLAHQLALHTLDETLSAAGRTLADNVLKYPTAATRQRVFADDQRPGVYRLTLEDGNEFAAAFILNATGAMPPAGRVVLYTPGEGFEEYETLARLNEAVAARLRDNTAAGKLLVACLPATARAALTDTPQLATRPPQIDADVIADSVRSLRVRQYFNTRAALREETMPVTGELDLAADLTPQLDVSTALAARNLRLVELREPDWLKSASPVDQARYRQLETAMVENNEALRPLLEKISTLTSFSAQETDKVLKIQKPAYAAVDIDQYQSLVRLRVTGTVPARLNGYRDETTGTVYITADPKIDIAQFIEGANLTKGSWQTRVVVDLRTLASYARRNVNPWSVHEIHRTITATADIVDTSGTKRGRLTDADLRALAQQADIGKKYDEYLRSAFSQSGEGRTFAAAWQHANAAKMNVEAFESGLNPAIYNLFVFKTPGSGLDWIKTITQYPDSTTRPQVGGFDIEVNLLTLGSGLESGRGGQVIDGVLVIQRKGTRADGVSVLYTPDAPDGTPFRELVTGLAELDTLKAKPEWRSYFTRRMATDDEQEIARIFSDLRGVHRYALTPITGNFHAYLYSAQLGFQLAKADYRSRSNAEVSQESAVNAFMLGVEVADSLTDLFPSKAALAFLRRGILSGLRKAQKLGRNIPGLIKKIGPDNTVSITIADTSIRPLEPAWVNVVEYRLPTPIDALFDVEAFALANNYQLSRTSTGLCFIDNHSQQFIAMRQEGGRYDLYQSYVKDGARYVKDPAGNSVDFMVVPGDAKSWKPRFERDAIGGGPVWSMLFPRTAEQQVDDDLIAALSIYSSKEDIKEFVETIKELSGAQKQQLLDNARQQLGVDDAAFRRMLSVQRGPRVQASLRDALLRLRSDADVFIHINRSTLFLRPPLSPSEAGKLFIKIKRLIGKNDKYLKFIRGSIRIMDPHTEAQFVGYAITLKQLNNLNKFDKKYRLSTWPQESLDAFINEKGRQQILSKIAEDHNITQEAALDQLLSRPEIRATLKTFRTERFEKELKKLGVESFSEDLKKSGIPYIAISQGIQNGTESGIKIVDSVTVTAFEKNISKFSTPLEFSSTRAQSHKVEKPSTSPSPSAVPQPTTLSDPQVNIVRLDDLADTQIPLLPESAQTKLDEIIQDIEAGRVSRKIIGNHTYVDLPQVEAGSGRGRWRAAFEKTGKEEGKDVFILKGIIDYHGSRLKAWSI